MERQCRSLRAACSTADEKPDPRKMNRFGKVAHLLGILAFLSGCGSFFGGPEPSGVGNGGILNACTWATVNDDCLANEYCDAPDCASLGACKVRPPPLEAGNEGWTCGCNGVTYWNTTFAHAQGVTAPTLGQCGGPSSGGGVQAAKPLACTSNANCPAGSVCLSAATCVKAQAKCWAWPDDFVCMPGGQFGFTLCDGTPGCFTECGAITTQKSYQTSTVNCK
jgi:hypothetical protein